MFSLEEPLSLPVPSRCVLTNLLFPPAFSKHDSVQNETRHFGGSYFSLPLIVFSLAFGVYACDVRGTMGEG